LRCWAKARPRVLDHPRTEAARDGDGTVARAAVDDDDLIAEGDTAQCLGQPLLLVLHDQTGCDAL